MGTVRSILDIDVNDTEFTHFQDLFGKYTDALAKTPNVWKNVGKEQAAMATQFERMTAALMAQNQVAHERKESDARHLKQLTKSEQLWNSIGKHSASLYRNVIGIGEGLLKWGGIATGLATGTALYGIDTLAHSVASERQTAMGLDISPAALRAFSVNFSRVVDPESFLGRMQSMEVDVGKRGPWYTMMGGRQMTGNAETDALSFMNAVRAWTLRTPVSLIGTEAAAFQLPFSTEELMKMRGTGNKEWAKLLAGEQADRAKFNLPPAVALAWQNLATQFSQNLSTIERALEIQLGRAIPLLSKFSDALATSTTNFITHFGNGIAKEWKTAKSSPWTALLDASKGLVNLFDALVGTGAPTFGPGGVVDQYRNSRPLSAGLGALGKLWDEFDANAWTQQFHAYPSLGAFNNLATDIGKELGLPAGLLQYQKRMESGTMLENVPKSSAGAMGVMQLMPAVAKALGVDPNDPIQSLLGGAKLDQYLMKKYKGNLAEVLAAYNFGEKRLDALLKSHPGNWQSYLPKETQQYIAGAVGITIMNATGGSAVVAVNQTAGH